MDIEKDRYQVKVLWDGKIFLKGGFPLIACTIRNISEGGAKLEIDPATAIPDEFELKIPKLGCCYHVRLVWRDTKYIGVEFLEKIDIIEKIGKSADSEAKIKNLRFMVRELSDQLARLGVDVSLTLERLNNI